MRAVLEPKRFFLLLKSPEGVAFSVDKENLPLGSGAAKQ